MNRALKGLSFAVVIAAVMGTKECQQDYEFAANVTTTTTTTVTTTTTDPDATTTTTTTLAGATTTTTLGAAPAPDSAVGIFQEIAGVTAAENADGKSKASTNAPAAQPAPTNWLGGAFASDEIGGQATDSEGDGFADSLEKRVGTDPTNVESHPPKPLTVLKERIGRTDSDGDGLSDSEEVKLRTDSSKVDTDGDGASDYAEELSGTNPIDSKSAPQDYDGDGLSDSYEVKIGTKIDSPDTDNDGLDDEIELAVGSDPRRNDTDHDGVLDGKEYELGGDPTIADKY
jgi:hypothetical protein